MDMTRMIPETHPLHRLFRGLTETTFMSELGIGDPSLVGYMAGLLASFVPSQAIWRIHDKQGRPLFQVTEMVAEAESAQDERRRSECHRHVGDYTLFWTGVYPEALAKLQGSLSADCLISYQQQGKRSYYVASTLSRKRRSRETSCGSSAISSRSARSAFHGCAASGRRSKPRGWLPGARTGSHGRDGAINALV